MKIIITSPSLDPTENVSGISSITKFIINVNEGNEYVHFELGKRDDDRRNFGWLFRILRAYIKWGYILFTQRGSLIHFNLALSRLSLIRDSPLIVTARLFRRRMVFHLHGGEFLMRTTTPRWMNYLLKINFAGRNPKICLSGLEQEVLKRKLKSDKIFVLPNCLELNDAMRFKRKYPQDQSLILLFMGRISVSKGLDLIFHALEALQAQRKKFKFIMAGKGPEEKLYVRKFRDLLGDAFEFKGVVSGDQKTKLLKACNVFLLPSRFEGLPMALLESMSFGLVPITTDVGSITDVVTNASNGLVINSQTSEEIVLAIEKLIEDKPFMQQLSRNAQQYIFRNYNPALYISKLNAIYHYE